MPTLERKFEEIGLTLREDENTFKSTYEIIKDLAEVWDSPEMTDMMRADILEGVAGKRQGQIIAAMIQNFDSVEESLKTAENSMGSAQAEFERAMESLEYKVNRLSEAMTRFWQNMIDRETMKNLVDALYGLVTVMDTLANNSIANLIINVGLLTGSLLALERVIAAVGVKFVGFIGGATAATAAAGGLTAGIKALTGALLASPLAPFIIGAGAIYGIYQLANQFDVFTSSIEKSKEAIEEYNTELESLNSEISQLEAIEDRTEAEENYLEILKEQEEILKRRRAEEAREYLEERYLDTIEVFGVDESGIEDGDVSDTIEVNLELEELEKDVERLEELRKNIKEGDYDPEDEIFREHRSEITELREHLVNELVEIEDKLEDMEDGGERIDPFFNDLRDWLHEVAVENKIFGESLDETEEDLKDNADAMKNYSDELEFYNKILDELNEYGGLSADTVSEIAEEYPELLGYLNDETWLREHLTDLIKEQESEQQESYENMLESSKETYPGVVKVARKAHLEKLGLEENYLEEIMSGNEDMYNKLKEAYEGDLENFDEIRQEKLKLEQQLINELGRGWDEFYSKHFDMTPEGLREMARAEYTPGDPDADYLYDLADKWEKMGIDADKWEKMRKDLDKGLGWEGWEDLDLSLEEVSLIDDEMDDASDSVSDSADEIRQDMESIFEDFPMYQEKVEDLVNELSEIENAISQTEHEIQIAEALDDTESLISLNNQLLSQYQQQENQLKEVRGQLEEIRQDVIDDFQEDFGVDITTLGEVDRAEMEREMDRTLHELNDELDRIEDDPRREVELEVQIAEKESKQNLYNHLVESFDDVEDEIENIGDEIADILVDSLESQQSNYEQAVDNFFSPFEDKISDLEFQMEFMDDDEAMALEPQILEQYADAADAATEEKERLKEAIENHTIANEEDERQLKLKELQLEYITEKQREFKLATQQSTDAVKDHNKQIADEVIRTIKDSYRKQERLRVEALRKEIRDLEENHREEMEMLDEKLSKYEDIIDAKLRSLDRDAEEEDFEKDLSKLQEERSELQQEINILQMDDSHEARARVSELHEEMTEKDMEIEELRTDRSRQLRRQNLEDMRRDKQEEIQQAKDAEEEKFDDHKQGLEDKLKAEQEHYDKLINNEKKYDQIRQDIIDGNVENMKDKLEEFLGEFEDTNEETVKEIESSWIELQNLINDIEKAESKLGDVRSPDKESRGSESPSDSGSTDKDDVPSIEDDLPSELKSPKTTISSSEYEIKDDRAYMRARDLANKLNEDVEWDNDRKQVKIGGQWFTPEAIANNRAYMPVRDVAESLGYDVKWDELLDEIEIYHDGGFIGRGNNQIKKLRELLDLADNEVPIIAEEGEYMLSRNMVDQMSNLANQMMGNANFSNERVKSGSGETSNIYNLNVRIDNVNGDRQGGQTVFEEIRTGLKRMGG